MAKTNKLKQAIGTKQPAIEEPGFWVKKVIDVSDVKEGYIKLNKEEVEELLLKHLNDQKKFKRAELDYKMDVRVLDLDKNTELFARLSYDSEEDSYYLGRTWTFVGRRWLSIGHEVAFAYDQVGQRLLFRVLRRGDAGGSKKELYHGE